MARSVTVEELQKHNQDGDLWIVVNDRVYDLSQFEHPGGQEIILQYAGRDGSEAYNEVHGPTLISKTLDTADHIGHLDRSTIPDNWSQPASTTTQKRHEKPPLTEVLNLEDFEAAAKQTWSAKAWAYIHGASNDNFTRDANKEIFRKILLRPAVMRNVKTVSTKTRLFGIDLRAPFYVAPTGAVKTAGAEGELAMTRAAAAKGTAFCISTPASFPYDEILEASPHPVFFQLYVNKDRKKSEDAVRKLEASGKVKAIFVTLDLPVVSKREADERVKMDGSISAPSAANIGPTTSASAKKGSGLTKQNSSFIDSSLSWDDISWLKRITSLPLVLKGIQRWEDVKTAHQLSVQGVVLSNHGGRAADTAPPGIITLLELHKNCPEVFGSLEILLDGGIRRGSDALKAICLGASAVGLGRPFLYAVNYGQDGVEHAIEVFREEIEVAMQLCGITNLMRDAGPEYVNTGAIDHLVRGKDHPYARKTERRRSKL